MLNIIDMIDRLLNEGYDVTSACRLTIESALADDEWSEA